MALVGALTPDFEAPTTRGTLSYRHYITGSWSLLFSFSAVFDPVATTELGMLAKLKEEFAARDCKIVAITGAHARDIDAFLRGVAETQGGVATFPVVADTTRVVSAQLSLVDARDPARNHTVALLVDGDGVVRYRAAQQARVGTNFYETLRVLDSLQLCERHSVETPVHWCYGDDVVVDPAVGDEAARSLFPKGFSAVTPYLRWTPAPDP